MDSEELNEYIKLSSRRDAHFTLTEEQKQRLSTLEEKYYAGVNRRNVRNLRTQVKQLKNQLNDIERPRDRIGDYQEHVEALIAGVLRESTKVDAEYKDMGMTTPDFVKNKFAKLLQTLTDELNVQVVDNNGIEENR